MKNLRRSHAATQPRTDSEDRQPVFAKDGTIFRITDPPRFVMLGGFLGAGKTTAVLRLALHLQRKGVRVGLITNDQAAGLVDTALAEELDLPVREIAGGCFCCRSEGLVEALDRLTKDRQPEVFITEPVGSCTDLVATVSLPLERIYAKGFVMAPYSVVVDPYRMEQVLGLAEAVATTGSAAKRLRQGLMGSGIFSPDMNYIYRKQLEEAEVIVINKIDVMAPERVARLRTALTREYPDTRLLEVSTREGIALEPWFELLTTEISRPRPVMEVDYARYGRGEAMLGWYNGKAEVKMMKEELCDGNAWLMDVARRVQAALQKAQVEIAHFKMTLGDAGSAVRPDGTDRKRAAETDGAPRTGGTPGLAAVSLVSTDGEPEMRRELSAPLNAGLLIVNLRAEGAPELLAEILRTALKGKRGGVSATLVMEEAFRPGQPVPTHRVATL